MEEKKEQIKNILRDKPSIKVGSNISKQEGAWSFDDGTYLHFDEHISNSIPSYKFAHEIIVQIADHFIRKEGVVYDFGCSTGTLTRMLALEYRNRNPKIIGIDSVDEMVKTCEKEAVAIRKAGINIQYETGDITELEIDKADLITSVFTMQFIHLSDRKKVLENIYKSLYTGGAFIWLEKVRAPTPRLQDIINNAYMKFKLRKFKPDEVLAKTFSLSSVMDPLTSEENHGLLRSVGFNETMVFFKSYCFEGILATKK